MSAVFSQMLRHSSKKKKKTERKGTTSRDGASRNKKGLMLHFPANHSKAHAPRTWLKQRASDRTEHALQMRAGREREGETNSSFGLFQFNNARRGKKQVIYFPGLEFRLPRSAFLPSRASLQFLCHIVVVFLRHKPFCELLSCFLLFFSPSPWHFCPIIRSQWLLGSVAGTYREPARVSDEVRCSPEQESDRQKNKKRKR